MSHSMPLSYVVKAVETAVASEIRQAVEKALLDSVMPRIKEIASDTATEVMRNASTLIEHDIVRRDIHMVVKFNGEIFSKEQA